MEAKCGNKYAEMNIKRDNYPQYLSKTYLDYECMRLIDSDIDKKLV